MPTRNSPASEAQRELRALLDENARLKRELDAAREERVTAYDDGWADGYNDGASDC